jgi:2-keto-4-pentenoate hydratase/2-oxohepta-3-ene-1,7-dioic acid hydratase in catechol pathway
MRFVTFQYAGVEMAGFLSLNGDQVIPFNSITELSHFRSLMDVLEKADHLELGIVQDYQNFGEGLDLKDVLLMAPLPRPQRPLLCLGKNYPQHIKEVAAVTGGESLPPQPIYFGKMTLQASGDHGEIFYREDLDVKLDYEVELAVIIGRRGKDIAPEDADEHIFGYTIVNDISARTLQKDHGQWFRGKSLDGFCPMGPWLVHRSVLPEPAALRVRSYVNGELRQDGKTADMIYGIPAVISNLSQGMTLLPGDIICMGTPAGVGMGFSPPRYLSPGDEVVCEIEGIGRLCSHVVLSHA